MAQYKVLKKFKDKHTQEVYEEGQEIEMTVKRADEAIKNLKKWNGEFLERIDNKEEPEDVKIDTNVDEDLEEDGEGE